MKPLQRGNFSMPTLHRRMPESVSHEPFRFSFKNFDYCMYKPTSV